jgi:hypothetical protein
MAKSRRKATNKPGSKGTARRTLSAARFFFDQAGRVEHHIESHEYYVEAAIVFAWMVLEHLGKEFSHKQGAKKWIKNLEENNLLLEELRKQRNLLSHEQPIGIVPSQSEGLYSAVQVTLRDQLDEIETIVDACEKQFG